MLEERKIRNQELRGQNKESELVEYVKRRCDTLNGCHGGIEFNSCSYLPSNALLLTGRSNDIILLIIIRNIFIYDINTLYNINPNPNIFIYNINTTKVNK